MSHFYFESASICKGEKLHSDEVLEQVYELLAICCLVLIYQYQDNERVMINNLCHKMALHTCILITLFGDGKGYVLYRRLQSFYDYIHTGTQKKPDIAGQKESMQ